MKSSKFIILTLLTGTALAVSACEGEKPVKNLTECVQTGKTQAECQKLMREAEKAHMQNAPRFRTQKECIAEYGKDKCEEVKSSGSSTSFFIPALMGYMMGRNSASPAYMTPGGSYTSSPRAAARSNFASPSSKSTTVRGGFGGSSRASVGA